MPPPEHGLLIERVHPARCTPGVSDMHAGTRCCRSAAPESSENSPSGAGCPPTGRSGRRRSAGSSSGRQGWWCPAPWSSRGSRTTCWSARSSTAQVRPAHAHAQPLPQAMPAGWACQPEGGMHGQCTGLGTVCRQHEAEPAGCLQACVLGRCEQLRACSRRRPVTATGLPMLMKEGTTPNLAITWARAALKLASSVVFSSLRQQQGTCQVPGMHAVPCPSAVVAGQSAHSDAAQGSASAPERTPAAWAL